MLRRRPPIERGLSGDLRDLGYPKRLAIAFAIALAVHEVIAGFWPHSEPKPQPETVVALRLTIAKRPAPTPSPTPAPKPTVRMTPPPKYTLAPTFAVRAPAVKAAATPHAAIGGAAAPLHVTVVIPRPIPPRPAQRESIVAGTHLGRQNGGAGTGAGAGNGTSGLGGTGSGTGTSGNGNGGNVNTAPCADIFLLPGRVDYKPDGTVLQHVIAKVVTRDGDVELGKFPYPFVYSAEKVNPFSHIDLQLASDNGIPVQQPPPGSDITSMPAMVQFVLKFTNPATGLSQMPGCTADTPSPAPSVSP